MRMMSKEFYNQLCCQGWKHNGDKNCVIPICSPECQNGGTCVAPDECECVIGYTRRYTACTTDDPDNITFIPDEPTIHEFGTLNITCLANCHLSCSFQWIKHGVQDIPEMLVSDLATMQISNATRKDAGNYSCRAKNKVTNKTVVDSITLEVIYHNDSRSNRPNDMKLPEEGSHESDIIWMSILTTILAGIAVILSLLICGFVVSESRKRCYRKKNNISTAADFGPSAVDLANSMVFELLHEDTDPYTNYWTIEEDGTGGLHTRIN